MAGHYNAFISYKHASEDNRVAEAVHKGLERFHIPGKIRKKTGFKRINRIFRDKDELPITNDLSDTIANALADSDYLIVICSTNTKESAWVPREIEYFLKNHSKRDVFTVLVDGEPFDVIPDVLKYDERIVKDENGNEHTEQIPIEPLSCDYRMPLSKAKKTELPRLACGIIGCAYDELMNRRRQYRMKQITAVFSIVLALMIGFSGYMYYSKTKIHKNYLESLKNQSMYLANESENLLEKEQRITALQLALEALPKDDKDDRPITAQAVKALTDATLAYVGDDGTNINAAWNYQMPNIVSDFKVSPDGKTIAILDEGGVVRVWNTETHEKILEVDDLYIDYEGIDFLNDSSLVMWSMDRLICYKAESGKKMWEYTSDSVCFDSDNNLMITDDSVYICTSEGIYLKLNSDSGKLENEIPIPEKEGYEGFGIVESKLSPDEKKIAFKALCGWNSYAYGVIDIGSKKMSISELMDETIKDIDWVDDKTLMVASTFVDMTGSMSFGSTDIISTDRSKIKCIDISDMSEKWSADFVCNGVMINSGFVNLNKGDVAYYSGNVITVYDLSSGKEQYSNNVNDSVIDVSDLDGDGSPIYITENGGYAMPAPSVDFDAVYYNRYFTDDLRQVVLKNGVYVRQGLSREVIYYGVHEYDDEWKSLSDDALLTDASAFCLDENCLAVLSKDDKGQELVVLGLDEEGGVVRYRLDGDSIYKYLLLGIYNGFVYMGYNNGETYELVKADVHGKDGEVVREKLFDATSSLNEVSRLKAGKLLYYSVNDNDENCFVVKNINSKNDKEIKLPEEISSIQHMPVYYEEIGAAYICGNEEYIFDIESGKGKKVTVPDGWGGSVCFSDGDYNGQIAVSDGKTVILVDTNGKLTSTIDCPGVSPQGMTFIDNELMVLYNDGSLYYYGVDDGEIIKKADVTYYYGFDGEVIFKHDEDNALLFIQMDRLTDVIDINSGVEIAHINNSFGYYKGRDIFLTTVKNGNDGVKVGYYKRYLVDELIKKAHKILQNTKLSDETKTRYGIK